MALICATRNCAAASAGLSNGAIAPLLSNAQPIVIVPADDDVERAAAVAATATTATAIAAAMSPRRELRLLIFTPLLVVVRI